jgi:hypothetical protein
MNENQYMSVNPKLSKEPDGRKVVETFSGSLLDKLNANNAFRETTKEQTHNAATERRNQDWKNLTTTSMSATNSDVQKKTNVAARNAEVAEMIRSYAMTQGNDLY